MESPDNYTPEGTEGDHFCSVARSKSIFEYLRVFFISSIPVRANSLKFRWAKRVIYSILEHILEYETDNLNIPFLAQQDCINTENSFSTIYKSKQDTVYERMWKLWHIRKALNHENRQKICAKYNQECMRQMVLLWSYPESSTGLKQLIHAYGFNLTNGEYAIDNNFFSAIAHQLRLHNLSYLGETSKKLFYKTIGHLLTHEPEVQQFIFKNFDDIQNLLSFFTQKKCVDDFITTTLSRVLNVTLVLFCSGDPKPQIIRQYDPIATLTLAYDSMRQRYHSLAYHPTSQPTTSLQQCINASPIDSPPIYRTPQNTPLSATTRIGHRGA